MSVEEYSYVLPDDMELLAKPENMTIEGAYIRYTATYTVEGNTLKCMLANVAMSQRVRGFTGASIQLLSLRRSLS
jgi:CRISPR/Cas system endoribonuclease Cas6 (RAMP superfamily)